ncbi:DUF6392 family protein [Photorhabdus thracensis]|nr:DUF6392 family protein [Photorhabdus thracensis]
MAVNVEVLINSLDRTYQEIYSEGLIPFKAFILRTDLTQ